MARIERISATQPVPVEQAQLIDPGAFRFSTASAEAFKAIGGVLEELGKRKIGMQDRIGISNINTAMENAQREYEKEIIGKPLEEHAAILQKHKNNALAFAVQQRLSPDTRELADNKLSIWGDSFTDTGEIATIKAIEREAIIRVTTDYEKALTEGIREDIAEAEVALDEQFKGSYEPAEAKVLKEKIEQRAIAQMEINAISAVHEAIETASDPETGTGNFVIATELAKSPLIPEPKQTSLRATIKTAQTVRANKLTEQRQLLIDKINSDTIREYFNGDLTVAELNERHAKGHIKDSEFKFMMTALAKKVPDNTDPFAAGRIRRAMVDFEMGAIKRPETDKIVLENYTKLDGPDRSTIVEKLEDIEAKIIATAKSNAYSEGRGLMSQRFIGIQSEEDLIDLFRGAGLTEKEKSRINRRWRAEVNNRDLYERAVDDRFKEMRKEKISDIDKYKAESLRILLEFQRRTQLRYTTVGFVETEVTLEEFEATVAARQQRIVKPIKKIKPVSEMTTAEKQRELERIRELKRLAR